jgi:hypothetical protein
MNVIGIRSSDLSPDLFNDFISVLWMNPAQEWQLEYYKATTDPGLYWLQHPENLNGTGILVEGQYLAAFWIGLHKALYRCLVQRLPVKLYRDRDKDSRFDLDPATIESGMFDIQIHRANAEQESTIVGKWSAGCQVVAEPSSFKRFMDLCGQSAKYYGNRFDYTLINEADLQ